jgi:hypothetical protein
METDLGDLLIRNVPEALKADLDKLADLAGESISDTAKKALREGIEAVKGKHLADRDALPMGQRLQALFSGLFDSQKEAEEFHRKLEEERKADFGRPLPDFE